MRKNLQITPKSGHFEGVSGPKKAEKPWRMAIFVTFLNGRVAESDAFDLHDFTL